MKRISFCCGWFFGRSRVSRWILMAAALLLTDLAVQAETTNLMYGGACTNWPLSWTALDSLNDPDDGVAENMDIVGDALNPAGSWAMDDQYVYFRMRIDNGAPGSNLLSGSLFIIIDAVDAVLTNEPLAIAWDSKEVDQTKHGLEMLRIDTDGTTWGGTKFNDIDGLNAQKVAPPDFGLSNGDGYIRMIEGVPTTNFSTTTYVDIAAKWSYLRTNPGLDTGQTWRIQFGSRADANDHNNVTTDAAANSTPTNSPKVWVPLNDPTLVDLSGFAVIEMTVQVVQWTTVSEQNTAWFNVYRQVDDQWIKINPAPIPAAGVENGGMGAAYSVVDSSAQPGVSYVYKLEEIESGGKINIYGPFEGVSERSQPLALSQPVRSGANGLILRWESRAGERYSIRRATRLEEGFVTLATGVIATPPVNLWQDPDQPDAAYYQIQIEP